MTETFEIRTIVHANVLRVLKIHNWRKVRQDCAAPRPNASDMPPCNCKQRNPSAGLTRIIIG